LDAIVPSLLSAMEMIFAFSAFGGAHVDMGMGDFPFFLF
jgi:hypothetical protein